MQDLFQRIFSTPSGKLRLPVVVLGSFFLTLLGIIPGLGLPGFLMLALGDSVLRWTVGFLGFPSLFSLRGDGPWSFAILLTLSGFFFLIVAYLLAFRLFWRQSRWKQWGVWMIVYVLWSIMGTALLTTMVDFGGIDRAGDLQTDLETILGVPTTNELR